jgi:hypothetical protein
MIIIGDLMKLIIRSMFFFGLVIGQGFYADSISERVASAILAHKKTVFTAVVLSPLIRALYSMSYKPILQDTEQAKYADSSVGWTIFNPEKMQDYLVFFLPGHKGFAKKHVWLQRSYKGYPLTEQLLFDLNYPGFNGKKEADKICEIMVRFEETMLNIEYRSYFGQGGDVIRALQCVKENHEKNHEKINLVGRSRGGYVALVVLGVLCTKHHPFLKQVGISEETREKIVEKLQKGQVIICVPLIDVHEMLKETRGYMLGNLVHYGILPLTSVFRYSPRGIKPIPALQGANDKKSFNITLIFAKNDTSVGTNQKLRGQLIDVLKEFGLEDDSITYVSGGHNDHFQQKVLLHAIVDKIIGSQPEEKYR